MTVYSKGKHPLYSGWYKNSTTDTQQIVRWWTIKPNANIGIPTGEKSGWLVLDVDDGGGATLAELEATNGKLPDTVTAITGSGGKHYVFKHPQGRNIPNKVKFAPGLDTRSTGDLIVATPSVHTSGNRYQWLGEHSPFDIIPAEAPEWLLKLMEVKKSTIAPFGKLNKAVSSISVTIDEGSRNSTLTSLAGTMRARGMTEESIYVALLAENIARCNPPLDEAEVKVIAHSVNRYQPNPPQKKYYHRSHVKFNINDKLIWNDDSYAWFFIRGVGGGTDSYFYKTTEFDKETWKEELDTNIKAQQLHDTINRSMRIGYNWSFRRSAGQSGIINLTYGLIAASLAEITDGFIYSDDDAWDYNCFPALAEDFFGWYFKPEFAGKNDKVWVQDCIKSIYEQFGK